MENEKDIVRSYKEISQDYNWDPSIFSLEDERVNAVKRMEPEDISAAQISFL